METRERFDWIAPAALVGIDAEEFKPLASYTPAQAYLITRFQGLLEIGDAITYLDLDRALSLVASLIRIDAALAERKASKKPAVDWLVKHLSERKGARA